MVLFLYFYNIKQTISFFDNAIDVLIPDRHDGADVRSQIILIEREETIMTVTSTGSSSLDTITAAYESTENDTEETEDALGQDAFLTMLVAQLQNQDPLNPADGTDFAVQLAQFSQLEQLMTLNDSIAALTESFAQKTDDNALDYIGKEITGNADTMYVDNGSVTGGFYNLTEPAEIAITITDENGSVVKTIYPGQQDAGSHILSWDGTDSTGNSVEDGTYQYTVLANDGNGYSEVSTSVSGTVDGVTYNNGKAYLVVQGVVLDPDSVTSVTDIDETSGTGTTDSAVSYLGRSVSSNAPIVLVEDGEVFGTDLMFTLESQSDVTVNIYDAFDELVRTIAILAGDTVTDENTVSWDALSDNGYQVGDGMYYYTAETESGYASTPVSGEVTAVKNINNSQYLVLSDSGRLLALSNITEIY